MCHLFFLVQGSGLYNININNNELTLFFEILFFVLFLLECIFNFVFLEIVEFKCCGLNKYTKDKIMERADEEKNSLSKIESGQSESNNNNEDDSNNDNESDNSN